MENDTPSLKWTSSFSVAPSSRAPISLSGDKILLPPAALEQLLSASTTVVSSPSSSRAYTTTFDPYNPYSYSAERQARELFQETQQQLPHPLTFRLVNPSNGRVVYAGIREFSAADGEVVLSPFLRQALGLENESSANTPTPASPSRRDNDGDEEMLEEATESLRVDERLPTVTVHARQLPKGTYARLRPLEAGYDPEDWKSLLEQHLRTNYTTLTNGEILTMPGNRGKRGKRNDFKFLIDKFVPEGEGICVVDTDLEVDIEALNEEQARETLQRKLAKTQKVLSSSEGSSAGGELRLWDGVQGQVLEGEYVDYEIKSWDCVKRLDIELGGVADDEEIDIFASPFNARQRSRPRDDEFVFGDIGSTYPKRIRLSPKNVELEGMESLWVSVYGYKPPSETDDAGEKTARRFYIRATLSEDTENGSSEDEKMKVDGTPGPDYERCKNCNQWVPKRTMILHENFCLRNNILCPHCKTVFKKSSPEWKNHWHCPHDSAHGNSVPSKAKHDDVDHSPRSCPNCSYEAKNLRALSHHRTTVCPGKLILCQFCHLVVPQEGDPDTPNAEAILSGLTPHELADGARTTECHLCAKIVRLRDMATHLKHHDLERKTRIKPAICRNVNCGRTLHGASKNGEVGAGSRMGQGPGNALGLCSICFGPLYVAMYDPEGRALRRRVERRYLTQLLTGCGKTWCRNEYCRTGREELGITEPDGQPLTTQKILPMVKPFVDRLADVNSPLHFCVDEGSQRRRKLAEMMAPHVPLANGHIGGKGSYDFEWYIAALEATNGNMEEALTWLGNWAPSRAESGR